MDLNIRLMIIEFKKDSTDNPSLSDFSIFLFIYNYIVISLSLFSFFLSVFQEAYDILYDTYIAYEFSFPYYTRMV